VAKNILVSAAELEALVSDGRCIPVDCRFEFSDTDKGRADWLAGHIPGAAYAHLDDDLSSPVTEKSGRHPLPEPEKFAAWLASIGWSPARLLVAYDEGSNAVASRLWWLMRYFGQQSALLDGGLAAWVASGRPLESGEVSRSAAPAQDLRPDDCLQVGTAGVEDLLKQGSALLLDARASQRFRGEVEPLDTRAGHIPGSLNRPFGANLRMNGQFKDREALRDEFLGLVGERDPRSVLHSCGSGVTACHNLFAMELAGLEGSRLYPGSWSEWIRDPGRPIETGDPAAS
jgi:thiosulfate/3-mercaptopyruvate sulfurtransferase